MTPSLSSSRRSKPSGGATEERSPRPCSRLATTRACSDAGASTPTATSTSRRSRGSRSGTAISPISAQPSSRPRSLRARQSDEAPAATPSPFRARAARGRAAQRHLDAADARDVRGATPRPPRRRRLRRRPDRPPARGAGRRADGHGDGAAGHEREAGQPHRPGRPLPARKADAGMSTLGAALQRTQPLAPGRALTDSYLLAGRYVRRLLRTPQLVVFQTVQPVMFMLLFVYVFGGAIHTQLHYIDYLIPGVLVQATLFGGGTTTVGLAQDLSEGMFDRFRSLPMTRPAVLVGRTIADVLKNVVVLALLLAVASAIGFRFHQPVLADLAAVALVLVFAYAAFVPTTNMPHWLRLFAEHQPVSITVNAVRALAETGHAGTLPLTSLAWSAGIVLVAAPLAITRYRRLQ